MKSYTWLHAIMAYRNEWSASAWRIIALVWEYEVNGRLELSNAQIAKEIEVSERHVKRAIGELKNRGLIKSGYRYVQMHIENRSQEKGHPVSHFTDPKRDISKQEKGHPVSHFTDPKRDISKQEKGHPVSPSSLYTTIPLSDDEDLIVDSRDPETSSPSSAPGSTFGENRIADLSFENNINNSEDPASPDAPTPPLPPLAPGEELPADWPEGWPRSKADFEQWVLDYSSANGCAIPIGTAEALRTELKRLDATLEDCCRYVIHTLSNMAGEDKGKIRRALVKPQRVREGLRQLREEAEPETSTNEQRELSPAELAVLRADEEQRIEDERARKEAAAYDATPEGQAKLAELQAMIQADRNAEARRERLKRALAEEGV